MTKDENQKYVGSENLKVTSNSNKLVIVHYGTDGMKWGRRKYQYEDGSLTPLGRIHYGVGEAKEKSKIKIREAQAKAKAAAKVEKAKAKAELEKIKAQAKAYRAKKDADEETERQRIKAEKEAEEARVKAELKAEKAHEREETRRVEAEVNADERMQEAGIEAAANQTKSENSKLTALKVVAGVAAAAGIGYLLYKKLGKSGDANSASKVIEKSEETGKKFVDNVKNKPAAEIIEKGNKAAKETAKKTTDMTDAINKLRNATKQEASSERVRAAKEKVARDELNKIKEKYFAAHERHKNTYTRILKSKAKTAFNTARKQGWNQQWFFGHSEDVMKGMVLIHSEDICHHGIKGQKWGIRRWQYEDGTLTPEGRAHYGRLGERHSDKNYKDRGAHYYTEKEYNRLNKKMSKYADKAEKQINKGKDPRKSLEKALTNMEIMSNEDAIRKYGEAQDSFANKNYLMGPILTMATGGLDGVAQYGVYSREVMQKYKNMSVEELIQKFNENIGRVEKVKKVYDRDKKLTKKEAEALEEEFYESKEHKEVQKKALDECVDFYRKEDPDMLERMLKGVNGDKEQLWRYPLFDTMLDGITDDLDKKAKEKYVKEKLNY